MRICGECEGCLHEDCGECEECLNMEIHGGDGTLKLDCRFRVCTRLSSGPRKRCGTCDGCTREDCGVCYECKHKSKFGGNGSSRQVCMARHCFTYGDLKSYQVAPPQKRNSNNKSTPSSSKKQAFRPMSKDETTTGPTEIQNPVEEHSTEPSFIVANLFRVPPPPTNILSSEKQIFPNFDEDHTQWARAMEPSNPALLSAAESFKARTTTRPPKVVIKKRGGSSSMPSAIMGATPASSETKSKLYRLKREMGLDVQTVSDESERPSVSDNASEEDEENEPEEEDDESENEESNSDGDRNKKVATRKTNTGLWSHDEKLLFLYGFQKYGNSQWAKISTVVPRTPIQVKSFAQKIRNRQRRGEDVFKELVEHRERLQQLLSEGQDAESNTREEDDDQDDGDDGDDDEDVKDDSSHNESSNINSDEEHEDVQFSTPSTARNGIGRTDLTVYGEDVFFDCSEDLPVASPGESTGDLNHSNEASNTQANNTNENDATNTSSEPLRCYTQEEIANFHKLPELADEYAQLSEYNKLLLEHIEIYRATQADVDKGRGRWKLSVNQIGFRCRICGDRKQNCSSSFPGRMELVDNNFYIIATNHVVGATGFKPCPLLTAEARRKVKAAQQDCRRHRGHIGASVGPLLHKMFEVCGIVQTNHGLKLRADLRPDDKVIGRAAARASIEKRNRNRQSQEPRKRSRKSFTYHKRRSKSTEVSSSSTPKRRKRSTSPGTRLKHAPILSRSRASRSVGSKTKALCNDIEERKQRRHVVFYESPTLNGSALRVVGPAFDSFIRDAIDDPSSVAAGHEATSRLDFLAGVISDLQPIAREIPPPRLSEETKNEVESSKYKCEDCGFPIEGHTMQLFPYADLVHLEQKNPLCESCKSHFSSATEIYLKKREHKLIDPWSPQIFPTPIFRVGGVSEEFMSYFLSLKVRLTASKARMKDFGRIPATGGQGKFQYLVGDKAEAEKRWQWQDCRLLQNAPLETKAIEKFALDHVASQLPLGKDGYRIDPGFVMTQKAVVQGPHRDFQGYDYLYSQSGQNLNDEFETICERPETNFLPFVLHCPLCREGMELNYWPETRKSEPPIRIHIPFGTFLLSRVDAVHGGIFGSQGNIRLHIAYTPMAEAIALKGKELQLQHSEAKLSNATIQRHLDLGATVAGQHQRKLDLLKDKDDISKYRDPKGVDDCERSYPIAYEEPGYAKRLLERNRLVWDASILDNISAEHLLWQ